MKVTKAAFKQYLLSKQQKEKQAFEKQHLDDELVMDAIEGSLTFISRRERDPLIS